MAKKNTETPETTGAWTMELTRKPSKQPMALFTNDVTGVAIYIPLGKFEGGNIPESLTLSGANFAPKASPTARKPKETKEERKARLAAMTPAEKLAAKKARLDAQVKKLAAEEAALAAKPATDAPTTI